MGWDWFRTEFGGYTRVEAGWISDTPDYIVNLPQLVVPGNKPALTQAVTLAPIEAAFTGKADFAVGKPLVARIPIGSTVPFKGLYLECRQQAGFDAQTPSAVNPTFTRGIPAAEGGILISYIDMNRDNPRIYVERPNELKDLSLATVAPGGAFVLDAYARHLEIANTGDRNRCVASISQSYTGNYTGYNVGFRPNEEGSAAFTLPPDKSSTDVWIDSGENGFGHFEFGQDVTQVGPTKMPNAGGDTPSEGQANRIWFRLHNNGDTNATNLKVKVMASPSPLGEQCARALRVVGTVRIRSIRAGQDAFRSIRWTPRGGEARGQVVLRASGGQGEVDRSDNTAQRSFDPFAGRTDRKRLIALPAAFGCRNPDGLKILPALSPGWRISLSPKISPRTRFVSLTVSAPPSGPRRPSALTFVKDRVEARDYPASPDEAAMPFDDVHQETIAATTLFRRYLSRSSLDLLCPQGGRQGTPVAVTGRVREAGAGTPVELDYASPNGALSIQRRQTDPRGRLTDSFVPEEPGIWTLQAHWVGDAWHTQAVSERCSFTVVPGQRFPRPTHSSRPH